MTQPAVRHVLTFDVGGTFTDLVLDDLESDNRRIAKVLTTPDDLSVGIRQGILSVLDDEDFISEPGLVVRGATTLITNALIERRGARTAFVTTAGFRHTLHFAREQRYDLYDLAIELPAPLVPIELCFEVDERVASGGEVLTPLDPASVKRVSDELHRHDVESLGVSLLHSYANPSHEEELRAALLDAMPTLAISLSSEVAPELREYERASTTVANAYVQPLVRHHLGQLTRMLVDLGYAGDLHLMLSHGGVVSATDAERFPIRLVESGPAAGALASAHLMRGYENRDALSFDMGGTTAKACLIRRGTPTITRETEVARLEKFKPGSGLPLKVPSVHLIEIGAGGGSIARIDALGLLKVGPRSAGSSPGPACYGLGGIDPTVTDTNLVLGFLGEESFLGGELALDRRAALRALHPLAEHLGVGVDEVALGIFEIVGENMAAAARTHVAELGHDLQNCELIAFGGAGPVHAHQLLRRLGIARCVIPVGAGVQSAIGLAIAPAAIEVARTYAAPLEAIDWARARSLLTDLESEARMVARAAGAPDEQLKVERLVDMRYVGQGFEVSVTLAPQIVGDTAALAEAFEHTYRELFRHSPPAFSQEVLTWRLRVEGPSNAGARQTVRNDGGEWRRGTRSALLSRAEGRVEVPVYDRYRLPVGLVVEGPALVEERETTTVAGMGQRCWIDDDDQLILEAAVDRIAGAAQLVGRERSVA